MDDGAKRRNRTEKRKTSNENEINIRLDESSTANQWINSKRMSRGRMTTAVSVVAALLVFVGVNTLPSIVTLRATILIPVAGCLYSAFRQEYLQRIIPLALVLTVVTAQLPSFLAVGIAAVSIVCFSLLTRPVEDTQITTLAARSHSDVSALSVIQAILVVIAVLLTENFLIWVVSATFAAGQNVQTEPPPLQDNGQRILKHILSPLSKAQVIGLRRLLNTQWSLVACLGASFASVELKRYDTPSFMSSPYHKHRTLFGLATRMAWTVAAARFVRTASFLMTVLPSQVPNCYAQRFPTPVPMDWIEWIWVGLIPRSHGGCNDLIISGHATVTSSMACVATSVADDSLFSLALWSMVVLDYAVEIYEGYHYSVDMWLGIVLVSLLWRVLHPLEGSTKAADAATTSKISDSHPPRRQQPISLITWATYASPAVVAYLQLIFLPQWTANFFIVLFVTTAVVIYVALVKTAQPESKKHVYMHVTQHILLCLLFMALGIYL